MTFVWAESGPPVLDARARAGRGARPPRRARARPRAAVRARARDRGDAAARAAARHAAGRCPATSSSSATSRATRATTPAATGTTRSELPDGRFGIVIGDVGGRGMDGRGDDGPDPQRAARLRAQGRRPARGDRRPARARRGLARARSRSSPSSTSCSTRRPARASWRSAGHLPPLLIAGRRALRRRPALPAARLQRRRPVHARALHARAAARRCGCSPTGSSSRAGARSTSAWPRSPRPPAQRDGRRSTTIADRLLVDAARARATTTSRCSGYAASASCASAVAQDPRHVHLAESPTRSAISRCDEVLDEAQAAAPRAGAGGERRRASCSIQSASSTRVQARRPRGRARSASPPSSSRGIGASRLASREAPAASRASVTSSTRHLRDAPATSVTLGKRPRSWRSVLADLLDARDRLLHAARDVDRPRAVAEVALELAEDGRHGVGGERDPAVGVVAVDGLHEAEVGDLAEVIERLARVAVLNGEGARERHVLLDQALARGTVPGPRS